MCAALRRGADAWGAPSRLVTRRRGAIWLCHGAGLLLALLDARPAAAHGADANQIQLVVHEAVAELVATPPVDFPGLRFADDDADGALSRPELDRHRAEVRDVLTAAVGVFDEAGRAATVDRADVSLPVTPSTPGAVGRDFVRLTLRLVFPAPPAAVRVRCGFLGEHPVMLTAQRADAASRPGQLALLGTAQLARLDAAHPEAVVFGALVERSWLDRLAPFVIPVALLGAALISFRRSRRSSRP